MNNVYKLSVTKLAQYVSRSGSLSSTSFNSVSGLEGTRLHQKIFGEIMQIYGDKASFEHYLHGEYLSEVISLDISGRADILIEAFEGNNTRIIEIKSFASAISSYDKLVRSEHFTQLMLYGCLYLFDNPNTKCVDLTLRYVSINTFEYYEDTIILSRQEAKDYFITVCEEYAEFARKLVFYDISMRNTIRELSFPYNSIRKGQKEFMKVTLDSLLSKEALFVQAPTGIGKTISTLYPAIKGLLKGQYDKIFYLTAKTATRQVASKAINDMRSQGLIIRSILLQSKEAMCPYGKKCDAKYCKLAKEYYSRVKLALEESLTHDDFEPELVKQIASKYEICPHELSLDILNYCQIIIGDYNHAFDPRVSLIRCFSEEADTRNAILIDEAHNLVDRSRDMFSAVINNELIDEMLLFYEDKYPLKKFLLELKHYFDVCQNKLTSKDNFSGDRYSCFEELEQIDSKHCLIAPYWEGTRIIPKNLYAVLWRTCKHLSILLEDLGPGSVRSKSLQFFFEIRFFLTILERYYNDDYITCIYCENGLVNIKLSCLDASSKLDSQIKDKMPVVFFSATLSPFEYYENLLVGKNCEYSRKFDIPSPFPPENLDIIIETNIPTTYKERSFTANQIAERIIKELEGRQGNYMCFFPSFSYMNMVMEIVKKNISKTVKDSRILLQSKSMNNEEKATFLEHFDSKSDGILLAGTVLGGHFGEGIDLVGDKLSGVIIVGVGIPMINPEREILSNYFNEKFGNGYAFAYRFPGWEKVLQAVGRVIRTEEDTGFALLIDDRLNKPEYLALFPDHWAL